MKIGILTFHSSINPGSILQAYCVYQLLKNSYPESTIELIDLVPYNREISEWNFFSKKPPFLKVQSIQKYKSARNFIKKNIPLSDRCYYRKLSSQIKYINKQNYDYILTGSDTVWMHSSKLDNLLPSIYFLPNGINSKKISIAATVDPLRSKEIYLSKIDVLKPLFSDYKSITVRDNFTQELMLELGVSNVNRIADPTLLFEFERKLNIPTNKIFNESRKNVIVWLADKKLEEITKYNLKKVPNVKFLSKEITISKGEDYIIKELSRYPNADIVITDRFHRSIFALKLSSALVINIEREEKNPVPTSKGRDLFNSIGISEYCIRYEHNNNEKYIEDLMVLINNYTIDKYEEREQLLRSFILKNKNTWQNIIQSAFRK